MQQLKIISTILKFIWRKQKRKQKSKEQNARQKQSRFTFLRHTPKRKNERKTKKSVSLNKETAEEERNL